ncbi:thioredoxin domain-containing protein [Hymenobacter elongatus]|uniref:Thioredoxin n=1 Tax=Hymenobacter elongatus TaxID=877208 RepID=A0A4Z0PR90_9BACT|nr:hypothetical protein [Hymenobacter elongatus]TGE20158.1 hypothetical protein E5J99_00900 [Hymenobacter elongatus]
MKESTRQRVHDTNDEGLRRYIHDHLKVLAMFTADDCPICAQLATPFAQSAADEPFAAVLFLRLSSEESPVAKKLMQQKVAPFFVSYCQGCILECDTLTTEAEVLATLQRLRQFQPHTS